MAEYLMQIRPLWHSFVVENSKLEKINGKIIKKNILEFSVFNQRGVFIREFPLIFRLIKK
jgi:hypothetical protein